MPSRKHGLLLQIFFFFVFFFLKGVDYVDLYYIHRLDPTMPVEETMQLMAQAKELSFHPTYLQLERAEFRLTGTLIHQGW